MYYPVYLDLAGRPAVVVGGTALAEEKARGLLAACARVTVIAPQVTDGLAGLADHGELRHLARDYQAGDLAGAALVIVVEGEPAERDAIYREATSRNILINTVDDLPCCTFLAPSVVRRGDLAIAISTAGKAPALAVRLRQRLEREVGEEHARFLAWAGAVRPALAALHPDSAARRALWYRLADSDALELLRRGDEPAARDRFAEILGIVPGEGP